MKTKLYEIENNELIEHPKTKSINLPNAQLILAFGSKEKISDPGFFLFLKTQFPQAHIAICSTAGEISDIDVTDGNAVITAMAFEKATVAVSAIQIKDYVNSYEAGKALANKLDQSNLSYAMILSDGALVNGSELIQGIDTVFLGKIPVTGGLAGDGVNFKSTVVGLNGKPESGMVAAIGFYGKSLQIGHGSMGGWDVFGPEKTITKSKGNVLFEIDNYNALALYKEYLGKYAAELPGSALLFPLSITEKNSKEALVRTILSIDIESQSLTFAGDVPEGAKVRFMKANFDNLIDAASGAANHSFDKKIHPHPDYALLISCVGRKIILKGRIEEEVEAVSDTFNTSTIISGFYSYGELSPFNKESNCQLHNQTMTITTFTEN